MPPSPLSRTAASRRALLAAWLVVAVAALLLGECQPLHVHADQGGGVYNESHILVSLATLNGDAPLPGPVPAARLESVVACALPAFQATLTTPVGHTADFRAPPLA